MVVLHIINLFSMLPAIASVNLDLAHADTYLS